MKRTLLIALLVAGCSTAQQQTAQTDINAVFTSLAGACVAAKTALTTAQQVAKGGALNTVNSYQPYIDNSCATVAMVSKLATDPSSLQWLGQIIGSLNTIASPPAAS